MIIPVSGSFLGGSRLFACKGSEARRGGVQRSNLKRQNQKRRLLPAPLSEEVAERQPLRSNLETLHYVLI